ncbi:phosphotransferase [Vibrio penaeicida]|uniref:phosphotransferase n=1 Tax=Vibrio penaeicida TaxID=104609 RepID=UPI00273420A6|nr:phosphotransferase [Vibrio penaeicida]MDP2574523.1 phosphotransferase [Vibrio penaeicida]
MSKGYLAHEPSKKQLIQKLWGDFGRLERWFLSPNGNSDDVGQSENAKSVIAKWIELPETLAHPKGWNTERSTDRKLKSYIVEANWYLKFSTQQDPRCLMPIGLEVNPTPTQYVIVMSDLRDYGLTEVVKQSDIRHWKLCLKWLANFHAKYLSVSHLNSGQDEALWAQGTYWHLDTRPDEFQAMATSEFKTHAKAFDSALKSAPFPTLVHGDAKLANFCFSANMDSVGAVDFQYVGEGCAMKDVMLFISSCVPIEEAQNAEKLLLDYYFSQFEEAMSFYRPEQNAKLIIESWEPFYYVAWADFLRFLYGWSPEHWKINEYSLSCATKGLEYIVK